MPNRPDNDSHGTPVRANVQPIGQAHGLPTHSAHAHAHAVHAKVAERAGLPWPSCRHFGGLAGTYQPKSARASCNQTGTEVPAGLVDNWCQPPPQAAGRNCHQKFGESFLRPNWCRGTRRAGFGRQWRQPRTQTAEETANQKFGESFLRPNWCQGTRKGGIRLAMVPATPPRASAVRGNAGPCQGTCQKTGAAGATSRAAPEGSRRPGKGWMVPRNAGSHPPSLVPHKVRQPRLQPVPRNAGSQTARHKWRRPRRAASRIPKAGINGKART